MHIKIGTRKSRLALWQAEHIAALLQAQGHTTLLVPMDTKGDKMQGVSIPKIGSKGVFTAELEEALLSGAIDLAVHSAKDMPSELPEGLELIAFTERQFINDVLVSHNPAFRLEAKGPEVVIGTSSTRRRALLSRHYPKAKAVETRGNLQTRIEKMEMGICDALLLAEAGVQRMGYNHLIVQRFPAKLFTPSAGQGSIAVETASAAAPELIEAVRSACNHPDAELCLHAERAFLHAMQGGCSVPVFALATLQKNTLHFQGGVLSLNGKQLSEAFDKVVLSGNHAEALQQARQAGSEAGALLLGTGADALLASIKNTLQA